MEFKDMLSARQAEVEQILDEYLPEKKDRQRTIMEAMEYSVKAGGKRIRSLLLQETYRMFSGKGECIRPFMAAMEMLHTYSLVHDDLPAMDNDEYRRGRKTTWVVYGEGMAVLCGDALLNYAYETAAKAFEYATSVEDYKRIAGALRIFMKKAGIYGMIGGQVVDIMKEGEPVDEGTLDFIFRLKTGALLEASLMIGAILAGAEEMHVRSMERIGRNIGIAFQIQDDILDVTGDEGEMGKPVLSDEKNNKTTYVTLYGLKKAHEDVQSYTQAAEEELMALKGQKAVSNTEFFEAVIQMLVHRTK